MNDVDVIGVASEVLEDGVLFIGPKRVTTWAAHGSLSEGLASVVGWDRAAHPWDAWPQRDDPRSARHLFKGQEPVPSTSTTPGGVYVP